MRALSGLKKMKRYMEDQLGVARAQGGEGLIAEFVKVEMEGGYISPNEMVSMLFYCRPQVETTTRLISGSVFELLNDPARREKLRRCLEPRSSERVCMAGGDCLMRRLTVWLRRFFSSGMRESSDAPLPFTPEEFGRLIASGKSQDMKRLAEGLSRGAVSRIPASQRG
ncbi:hypothetical protein [Bradyrhizobium sp.]|uniref:hypothetical protein n=1 Tax=Bradyrhizobium sp. TaxID=376 RepID=UPI003C57EE2A